MGQQLNVFVQLMISPLQLLPQLLILFTLIIGSINSLAVYFLELLHFAAHLCVLLLGFVEPIIALFDLELGLFELRV